MPLASPTLQLLLAAVVGVLVLASLTSLILSHLLPPSPVLTNLRQRINAWWAITLVLGSAIALGTSATLLLFALLSFLSLRELITLTPTRPADHRTLLYAFFLAVPSQYLLLHLHWYGLFAIFLPVYGLLFIAVRTATAGDPSDFLARTARTSFAVLISTYFLSHAPALLTLPLPEPDGGGWRLLVFLVLVSQASDVLQYVWGKLLGRHKLIPTLSPHKTTEGLVGGALSATLLGTLLHPLTPFAWWQATLFSLLICLWGFFGGLVMSAIKRDADVKDFGTLLPGHGGISDRIDSLAFAAPIFFHLTRYFFLPHPPI